VLNAVLDTSALCRVSQTVDQGRIFGGSRPGIIEIEYILQDDPTIANGGIL